MKEPASGQYRGLPQEKEQNPLQTGEGEKGPRAKPSQKNKKSKN